MMQPVRHDPLERARVRLRQRQLISVFFWDDLSMYEILQQIRGFAQRNDEMFCYQLEHLE